MVARVGCMASGWREEARKVRTCHANDGGRDDGRDGENESSQLRLNRDAAAWKDTRE